jgi:hypothetical protein
MRLHAVTPGASLRFLKASCERTKPRAKPVYTNARIAQLYDQHRRGAYTGREAEWARLEVDIIAAGREGRIQNPVDLHGK